MEPIKEACRLTGLTIQKEKWAEMQSSSRRQKRSTSSCAAMFMIKEFKSATNYFHCFILIVKS